MNLYPNAIFRGFVADVVLTLLGGVLLLALMGVDNVNTTRGQVASFIFGSIATIVSGHVTASRSPDSKFANVVVLGILGVVFVFVIAAYSPIPMWQTILCALVIIPLALLGAYFESRGN